MPIPRKKDQSPSQATAPGTTAQPSRKPWKKKTPVEILLDQRDKLQEEIITRDEEALTEKREQLKKFEEAAKLFQKK